MYLPCHEMEVADNVLILDVGNDARQSHVT